MVDTYRALAALQALLADNSSGDISAQDIRDFLVSVHPDFVPANLVDKTATETISAVWSHSSPIILSNNVYLQGYDTGATARTIMGIDASDIVQIGTTANIINCRNDTDIDGALTTETGFMNLRQIASASLDDIGHAINTDAGKREGSMVFNVSTNKPVWATGGADGSVWVDATGATVHTPVTP